MPKFTHAEILDQERIPRGRPDGRGRYYTTCPQCSHLRKQAHRKLKCLGVTIDNTGVGWKCSHCGWKDGRFLDGAQHQDHAAPNSTQTKPKKTYSDLMRAYR